jgi:hypothetical protein
MWHATSLEFLTLILAAAGVVAAGAGALRRRKPAAVALVVGRDGKVHQVEVDPDTLEPYDYR